MEATRWAEVQRLFHAALERPTDVRAAWLAAAAGADPALRGEVEALLAADAEPATLLDRAPAELLGTSPSRSDASASGELLAAGDRVGSYRVVRRIGRGGMGVVYLADDERRGGAVALKVLRPVVAEALAAAESRARFLREIRVGSLVAHPHLVPVLDSGDDGGRLWLAMPHVDGESLRDLLRRERMLPTRVALGIGRQVAEALAWLAARDIVHRDVKPDNVLLARDPLGGAGHAMLADFGVARALDLADADGRLTATGAIVGTVRYMSPEQLRGEHTDARADVFALGCLLFEMLTGTPPYRGVTMLALVRRGPGERVRPDVRRHRDDVPAAAAEIIRGAIAADPAERPTSADAAAALADALAGATA